MSSSPFSSSPDHHRRTTSQQSFPPQGDTPNSGRTSTVGGGGRSTVLTNNNYNRAASVSGGGGGGGDRASHIGRNSSIGAGSRSGINTNNINGKTSSSASNSAQQQQQQQLFEAGGAGAARRALLYDVERHKLESLPLTRLFRFLADSPHWLGTGGGIDGATSTGSAYEPTEGGDHSNVNANNNNKNNKNNKRPSSAAVVSAPRRSSSSSHMIKNLVVASPEGGRHVSKRQRDIDRARMASVLADGHDDLIIPDTIVWEASIPRGWFYTSFDGQDGRAAVQRRSVDIGVIEKQWTEGLPPNAVAASYYTVAARDPAASLADKDTPLLQFQFLRACELSKFLHVQATQTSGSDCAAILQQFTYPLHAHNVVIQAVWSPRVLNITVRQNINALHDGGLDPNSRACTFEGSPHLSQELRPTTRLYGQVESAVHSLTKHFAAVDLKNRIVRIVAYFKVDKESRLNLLYVPSIRVMRTSIIEKPIGLKSNPFFSAFRVALDVAVEYETLTTNANAFTSGIGNNDANLTNAASSLSASPMLGGGGSRIRKSASNKNKNNNEGNNSSNNKPISSKKPGNFEGSRLLADALDLAEQEMHLEKYQTQQNNNNNNANNSPNRNQDSNSNESGMFENKNHQSPNTSTTTTSQRKGDEESIQFKLSHSPVIGQQRADLVEIVMEIVRNSHHAKEAQTAVTKAFRHAATPAARDALKWAAVESGFLCHDDDSYSHPFFEVGPELMEIMKFVCEDYREEEEEEGGEDDDDDDDGGEDKQEDDGMMDRSLIGGNNSRTFGGVNNNNKNDNNGGDSSGGFKFRNNQHYQHPHQKVGSNNHNAASSPSTGPTSPGMASHEGDDHSGILLQPQADIEQNGTKSIVSSPPPPPPLPPSLAKSGQQGNNNNNNQKSKNTNNHNNSLRSNKSPISAASSQRMKQSINQHPFANTNENNNSNSFVSGGGGAGGVVGPCWKKFAQVLKSGVSDFLYEVTDNGVQSAVALNAASTSVFGGANNVPFDFSGALGSISADAHQICEIVLELFLNFHNNNNSNNNTSYSYSNLLHRVLPLAIGSLWKDVAVRDAVAILSCVIFGIMSVQNNSVNPQSQGKNSNGDGGVVEDDQFYLNLIENDKKEKEKTKERKRQQWIKQQQIDEEEFYATKQKQQRESNNNNNNLVTSMSSSTDETNNKGLVVPLSPTSSITSPTSSKPTQQQQQQQKSSSATTFVAQPQPEDISMYFEGLRTAVPLFKPNHIETIKLKPEGALDLQGNATTYQLVVSVKNATRMGLECQVRKLLGDVLLSEENNKSILANCFLDLLLPEVLEERRKPRILQIQQQQQNQSPTTTTALANKTKKIISPTVTMTTSSVTPSSHVRRNTIKSSNTPSIGSSPILVYNSKTNFDFMTTSPILQANNNNNNNNNKLNSAARSPQVKEKATTNIKTPKNIFHASSSDDEL